MKRVINYLFDEDEKHLIPYYAFYAALLLINIVILIIF